MPVMEAPGLTYGCGTADASRMLRKLAAPSPGKDAASAAPKRVRLISRASNSRELSRLLAAKMSCNRRHADVMNVGWPVSATDAIFARRGTGIDGGIHASCTKQYDFTLDWIVCFCSGPWNAPRLARRCPAEVSAAGPLLHAVVLRHAGGVPEHPAGQCGLLDALRPPRIDRDGRRPRSTYPSADPARCKRRLRRRRER